MVKGVGKHQLDIAEESRMKILHALSGNNWLRYKEVVEKAGIGTTTASKFLKIMEKAGEVEKRIDLESGEYPYPVLYRLTNKGVDALKRIERRKIAETVQTYDVLKSVREKVRERIDKTIGYMVPSLEIKRDNTTSKLKGLIAMYATTATLGFFQPNFKEASEKLRAFSEGLVNGLEIGVDPTIESIDEDEAIGEAILEFLGKIFKSRTYRDKVVKMGKLNLMITIDLSKIQLSPDEKSDALFWGLVFEGLRKEGRI